MSQRNRKDYPLAMRLPESDIAIIDRAAGIKGRSRTEFVRDAAVRAAEEVVMDNTVIRMSPEGFAEFESAIAGPGKAVPELVRVFEARLPWSGEDPEA